MATRKGMHGGGGMNKRSKGRTSITEKGLSDKAATVHVPQALAKEANRPITGGVLKRGDRRDMSRTYTNNEKHAARGNTPRKDVSTRAR